MISWVELLWKELLVSGQFTRKWQLRNFLCTISQSPGNAAFWGVIWVCFYTRALQVSGKFQINSSVATSDKCSQVLTHLRKTTWRGHVQMLKQICNQKCLTWHRWANPKLPLWLACRCETKSPMLFSKVRPQIMSSWKWTADPFQQLDGLIGPDYSSLLGLM